MTTDFDGRQGPPYLIGVDVGTGSARAGVFDTAGALVTMAKCDIDLFREEGAIVEQSANQIWEAVCRAVREAVAASGVRADRIAGIGFDATCSLVVVGPGGRHLPVGPSEDPERNVIVWMDHRAVAQAERINAGGHDVLRYVGGRISPEMETPKLLWLKENRPETFDAAEHFFDLTDYLTWRATGDLARSICTVTCKWTYLAHEARWDGAYFRAIGLGVLADEQFLRIGRKIVEPGTAVGTGLSTESAVALGLRAGTPVAAGLIDAHAGGIGTVGGVPGQGAEDCMAYVFGTSSCTMTTTRDPVFVPGVWGPYYAAMVPGAWLNEGGQSVAGAAIDHLVRFHPASSEAAARATAQGCSLPDWLARQAEAAGAAAEGVARLAEGLHVVPDFLGNRAPHADPHTRAIIAGLGMDTGVDSLVRLYVAGILGLGYGLRQIVEAQRNSGAKVKTIVISGGAGRAPVVRQLLADATGLPVSVPRTQEPVLLGSAMLGGVAGGVFPRIVDAMAAMSGQVGRHEPFAGKDVGWHDARYAIFSKLQHVVLEGARAAAVDAPSPAYR
ncbi:MAG: FGGY-family carbohydrate kinase [Paracoccaceae bacterium]|nr:FGGY-family carbohydrate kinase [Paracoccaceae bacterium]